VRRIGKSTRGGGVRLACAGALLGAAAGAASPQGPLRLEVSEGGIPRPLASVPGDPGRGRKLVVGRDAGACTLCHAVPGERIFGNIAPTLAGVGSKLTAAQLRLRVADSTRLDPETPMPAYYRTEGLRQVAAVYRGKTILSAQEVEDVVAYLETLKEPK
jgi:sulfur-oxidizing protein SoxX